MQCETAMSLSGILLITSRCAPLNAFDPQLGLVLNLIANFPVAIKRQRLITHTLHNSCNLSSYLENLQPLYWNQWLKACARACKKVPAQKLTKPLLLSGMHAGVWHWQRHCFSQALAACLAILVIQGGVKLLQIFLIDRQSCCQFVFWL